MKIRTTKGVTVLASGIVLLVVAGVFGWIDSLFSEGIVPEFWRNVVLLLFGVPVGVFGGLLLNQLWEQRQGRKKRSALLRALRAAFDDNLVRIRAAVDTMLHDVTRVPTEPMDLGTLDSTTSVRYELLDDPKLRKLIDRAHSELRHLTHRIDLLNMRPREVGEIQREEIQGLCEGLLKFHETRPLGELIMARTEQPSHGLRTHHVECALEKSSVIGIAVGLTEDDAASHSEGGVYGHCKAAIDAIDDALRDDASAASRMS